ncbi:MAG: SdrD B-like domain-containing protein [Nitrososphaerota archaeon]
MSTIKCGIVSKSIAKLMLCLLLTSLIIVPLRLNLSVAYNGNEINWDIINWILIDTDKNEPGGEDWRDVIAAYLSYDSKYLYLRLDTVEPPRFPTSPNDRDDDKYRWFMDLDGNMYWQGEVLYEAEYLISIQDKNDDGVGEFYLLHDSDNDSDFDDEQWVSIPVNSTDGGYRIFQNRLEIYLSWSRIGGTPSRLWLSYCTDRSDKNLNQCPAHDRAETTYDVVIRLGAIQGYKWKDLNKNGAWDENEPPLENWKICLRSGSISLTVYTSDAGFYQFIALPEGIYTISEEVPAGWIQTYPENNTYLVQITSGELIVGKNFGNFETYISMQLKKTANAIMAHEGDEIEYTFNITNVGNVPLQIINLTDNVIGSFLIGQLLKPNESITKNYIYSVKEFDPDDLVNVATAYATYDGETIRVSDNWVIKVLRPSIKVEINANATEAYIGDTIQYTINVTNTGNCMLSRVNVSSTLSGKLLTGGILNPKQSLTFKVNYIAQNHGILTNIVNASGIDQLGLMVQDEDSFNVNILIPPAAPVSITKLANVSMAHVGDTIRYFYTVANIGSVVLTGVYIVDNVTGRIDVVDELSPGSSFTVYIDYTVRDADPDPLVNNATVYATYNGQQVSAWDIWTVDILHPAISVSKTADRDKAYAGETINYTIIVKNTGDCPLYNVNVTDTLLGVLLTNGFLDKGGNITFTKKYTVEAGDEDPLVNTVTVEGKDPLGMVVSANASCFINTAKIQYKVTVDTNLPGVVKATFNVTYTKNGITYTEDHVAPWSEWVDSGTNVTVSNPQVYVPSEDGENGVRYRFSGFDPASTVTMDENKNITLIYIAQYLVTFNQMGLDDTATGIVVTIDGVGKTKADLPFTDWLNHGSNLTFSYSNTVASSSSGKQFVFISVSHTSPLTITEPTTITGNYKIQYYLTVKTDLEGFNILGSGWYDEFAQVTLEAPGFVPSEEGTGGVRYRFSHWDIDGTEMEGNPITVYMNAPHTATAHYTKQYHLRVIDNIGGLSGVSNQSNWFDEFTYINALNAPQQVIAEGERYIFTGWNVTFPIQMNSPKTVMAIYIKQYLITFDQTGLDETATGIILTVNGFILERSILPFSIWAYEGDIIEYKYEEVVSSTVSGKRFKLEFVTGPSSPIIVSGKININGKYMAQWLVIFNQTGLDETATGTLVTIEGEAKAYSELPFSKWVDDGSIIAFAYSNIIDSLVQGKRFALINTSHTSPLVINAPTIVTGNYKIQYRLIVHSDHDYPSPSVGEHWYDSGTIIVASVTSPAYETSSIRYRCTGWTGTGSVPPSGTETSVTFTINMPSSITWNWKTQYYLTVTTNPAEVLSLNPNAVSGGGWYDAGATTTVNAVQNVEKIIGESRYEFRYWTGATPTSTGNQATVYMDAPKTVIANYQLQFNVTFVQTGVGTDFAGNVVTIDGTGYGLNELPKSFWWDAGSTHSFVFQSPLTVDGGKRYVWTSTTGFSTSQSSNITISSSGSITGNYKTQYYLTVRSTYGTTGGEGWYDSGTIAYATVTPLTVLGTPGTRYVFTHWTGDASGTTSPSNPITMNAPKTAIANWKTQHLVTFTQTGLDAYAIGSILKVNGSDKTTADLPFTMWIDQNVVVTYSYATIVSSSLLNTRYILESVTGPASPVTVTQPLTITGNYGKTYYLEVVSEYGSPYGSGWYRSGSTASFGVSTPVDHGNRTLRVFLRWLGDIELYEPKGTVTVTRPMRIIAQWQKMYLVTFNTTLPNNLVLTIPNVPTTLPPGMNIFGTYYPAGENVTVGPAPKIVTENHEKTRYVFKEWSLYGQPFAESETISFIVKQPYDFAVTYWTEHLLEISAKGVKDPFKATLTVTASNPTSYELSPESPIQQWIRQGTTATLTISTPNKIGHGEWAIFQMWSTGGETSRIITITILSPTTIDAIFFKVNPVAMSIPYSIIAGLIAMLICAALIRKRKPEEKKRKRISLLTGTLTTAAAIIIAAIVSSIIAVGYGIKPIELIDFTNWAVIFLIIEAAIFFSASTLIARKVQRVIKT